MFKNKKELHAIMLVVMPSNDELSHWARIGLLSKVLHAKAYVKSTSNDAELIKELDEIQTILSDKITKFDSGLL